MNLAVRHLGEKFTGYGYDPELIPDEDWTEDDFPAPEEMGVYLENLRRLRSLMPITSPLPESMDDLGIAGANQIEAVLVELDRFAPLVINTFYAGEIYSGET